MSRQRIARALARIATKTIGMLTGCYYKLTIPAAAIVLCSILWLINGALSGIFKDVHAEFQNWQPIGQESLLLLHTGIILIGLVLAIITRSQERAVFLR